MATPPFTGVAVALVTLFDDDLRLDAPATADLAARLVDAGVSAVVTAGSTGEASTLTVDERVELVQAVKAAVPAGTPVIAGTGAPSSAQAIELTTTARDAGADAALVLSPLAASDPRPYYDRVAAAVPDLPLLAYHFPAVSSPGIDVDHLADLPVVGLKDSSGDADRLFIELDAWDRPVYPGSSVLTLLAGAIGCPGVILALANAEPETCVAAFGGDAGAQYLLGPPARATRHGFPHTIKALTAERFGTSTAARMG
ncbi:MAG TPA: dihydrodipicolinate synthase family protein [Acidimicrobiales bacterium]